MTSSDLSEDIAAVWHPTRWANLTKLFLCATSAMVIWCSVLDTVTRPLEPSSPYDGPALLAAVVISSSLLVLLASGTVFTAAAWLHATVWRRSHVLRSNYLRPGVLAACSLAWTVGLAWVPWLGFPFILATVIVVAVDVWRRRLARLGVPARRLLGIRRARLWTVRNQRLTFALIGIGLAVTGIATVVSVFFVNPPPAEPTNSVMFAAMALVGAANAVVWWVAAPGLRRRVRRERVARVADLFTFLVPASVALVFFVNASLYSLSPVGR